MAEGIGSFHAMGIVASSRRFFFAPISSVLLVCSIQGDACMLLSQKNDVQGAELLEFRRLQPTINKIVTS